jgi:hypothetical protein
VADRSITFELFIGERVGVYPDAAELLALEERQLFYFQADIRPVGEEKSELYPEPKYFHIAFQTMPLMFPHMRRSVLTRTDPVGFGKRIKRPLARCTALHASGAPFVSTWGRQMWLDLQGTANDEGPVIARFDGVEFTDTDVADDLFFWYAVSCSYREDGFAYPSRDRGLGLDYRIISDAEARIFADNAVGVDLDRARELVNLWATVRALSFLMEAETRDALMMHGPYPLADGRCFVMFECNDLNWRLYPEFPIPGQRWEIPDKGFSAGDLSVGLVLRDVDVRADRMGTLYVTPWSADQVEAATLVTRGPDEWADGELRALDVADAGELARACDVVQESAFLQLAEWNTEQRMAAGHCQKLMFMLRVLAGSGASEADIRAFFGQSLDVSRLVWERHFQQLLNAAPEDLVFYARMSAFAAGKADHIFTPLRGTAGIS